MADDWQRPMRALPGPVLTEELQMSVAERERIQRGVEELARNIPTASAGAGKETPCAPTAPSQPNSSETHE